MAIVDAVRAYIGNVVHGGSASNESAILAGKVEGRETMNVFEQQLIALAEAMAEKLIEHMVAKLEAKLGIVTSPMGEKNATSKG